MKFLSVFSRHNSLIYRQENWTRHLHLLANIQPAKSQLPITTRAYSRLTAATLKYERGNTSKVLNANLSLFDEENVKGFNDFLSTIVLDLNEYCIENNISEFSPCIENLLTYNTQGGKKFRGMATSFIYQKLMARKSRVVANSSYVLGWCVEIIQASFLIVDDLMDGSSTRRGRPCWYKLEGKGLNAANDTLIMEQEVVFNTTLGQALDVQTCGALSSGEKQKIFTKERYDSIIKLKTSYYTLVLPAYVALAATENAAQVPLKLAKEILLDIGHMFQAQDDFLDCFGDEKVTGKFGTDIADGKCTWLALKALELASPTQRIQLTRHYGRGLGVQEEASVKIVKDIYTELNLEAEFKKFEREFRQSVQVKIQNVLPENQFIFTTLLEFLFKRSV